MSKKATPINYIELKSTNLAQTKAFYGEAFGWSFVDYGDSYVSFQGAGIDGGFELTQEPISNGVLVVLLDDDLPAAQQRIKAAGGKICVETFSFPGGERFQFLDLSGNELAVWKYT